MLRTFNDRLKTLALDPRDSFTTEIRRIAGPRTAPFYEHALRRMILRTPAMLAQIRAWAAASEVSSETRRLHDFALAYLQNPQDFLPERNHGFFGYLDDAYLVASVYDRTMHADDWAELSPLVDDLSLPPEVPGWISAARALLPDVMAKIDRTLDALDGTAPWRVS